MYDVFKNKIHILLRLNVRGTTHPAYLAKQRSHTP